jgi:hypothetical protein
MLSRGRINPSVSPMILYIDQLDSMVRGRPHMDQARRPM